MIPELTDEELKEIEEMQKKEIRSV